MQRQYSILRGYRKKSKHKNCERKEKEEVDSMENRDRRANTGIEKKGDGKERWYWRQSRYYSQEHWDSCRRGGASHESRKRKTCTQKMTDNVRNPLRDAQQRSKGKYSRNKPRKQAQNTWWNAAGNQGRRRPRESRWQNCISLKTEKNGENNSRGIVMKCTLIRRQEKRSTGKQNEYFKKKRNQQFTEDGRDVEITEDPVLPTWAVLFNQVLISSAPGRTIPIRSLIFQTLVFLICTILPRCHHVGFPS